MKKEPSKLDLWYAAENTKIISMPSRRLETFGATILTYHMISEFMDSVGKVRVREGRIHAGRPEIVTPYALSEKMLEGFGEEAQRYAEFLKDHAEHLKILKYGFQIRKEEISQHVVTEHIDTVAERVTEDVRVKADPFAAVITGVDDLWEVCLLRLIERVVQGSVDGNVGELERRGMFARAASSEIESAFEAARRDSSMIGQLAELLKSRGVFEDYEDRFFALIKSSN